MKKTIVEWLGQSLVIAAATMLTACAGDAPVGPDRSSLSAPTSVSATQAPNVDNCPKLVVDGTPSFHAYAEGVQIYRWNGTSWVFVAPSAGLFADAGANGQVGTHYAGPTWESNSGSKVVGAVAERCTPDATAIQWLKLAAVSAEGPGIFEGTKFIQRVNTVGGLAPSTPGTVVGEEARVPYTAEYFFYR